MNDPVTVAESVAFIVERLSPAQAQLRSVDDAVRHRVKYALKVGHLRLSLEGKILFGDLVAWGRTKSDWSAALARLPSLHRATATSSGALFGRATAHAMPSTAAARDAALREAYVRIDVLEAIVKAQADELARLRPIAAEKERLSAVSSKSGKKGGRPRKS